MEVLEINEFRIFGLMAVLDLLAMEMSWNMAIWLKEGSEKPPHDQAPVF